MNDMLKYILLLQPSIWTPPFVLMLVENHARQNSLAKGRIAARLY